MSEAKLPTAMEIFALPQWARVAFTARCARRALLLFRKAWPDAPAGHVASIEEAVNVAERAAATAVYAVTAHVAAAANDAAIDATTAGFSAAANAAAAAVAAADTAAAEDDVDDATVRAAAAGVPDALIVSDFHRLRAAAAAGKWDNTTPVPPTVFGPLDEPAPPAAPKRLVLKAYMRPDADPEKIGDKLVELYAALNDYCLEEYGVGLAVEDFEQFLKTGVLDPVGEPS